ncbi:DUF1651 domain-containing protein [Synechococcus sp. CBW1107]
MEACKLWRELRENGWQACSSQW